MQQVGIGVGLAFLLSWSAEARAQLPTEPVAPASDAAPEAQSPQPSAVETAPPPAPPAEESPKEPTPSAQPASRGRVRWVDKPNDPEEQLEVEPSEVEDKPDGPWTISHTRFALSVERATVLMAFKQTATVDQVGFATSETSVSGVDVGFLGSGGAVRSPSSLPRIAFDGVLSNRFSLGGALSYMSTSSTLTSASGAETELGEAQVFLFAPRIGALLKLSDGVALWLKTGLLRAAVTTELPITRTDGSSDSVSETVTTWAWTLEPQLVLLAAPHVGITVSPHAEIGLLGRYESSAGVITDSDSLKLTHSAYGLSGGLMALF